MTKTTFYTFYLLTISPLSIPLLSQSFLSKIFILVFVPLSTEVILTGLEAKRKTESGERFNYTLTCFVMENI